MLKFKELLEKKSKFFYYPKFINILHVLRAYLKYTTFPFYTGHDLEHCESLEVTLDNLVSDEVKEAMNEVEIFILLCAAYFHDIGMAVKLGDDEPYNTAQTAEKYSKKKEEEKAEKPTGKDAMQPQKECDGEFEKIRRTHPERTYKFLTDKNNYKIFTLDKGTAFAIAEICKAHSDIKNDDGSVKDYTFQDLLGKNEVKAVGKWDVRMHFLAALIRIADELDLDFRRSIEDVDKIRELPPKSRKEHMKHQLISGIKVDSSNFEIFVDIFEDDLYSGKGEISKAEQKNITGDSNKKDDIVKNNVITKAEKNEGLTGAVIKLRKALREVVKPLNDNALIYNRIKFRDPAIKELSEMLEERYAIIPDTSIIYKDKKYGGALIHRLFYDVESLNLSPEYIISNKMDFLFFEDEHFDDSIDYILEKYLKIDNNEEEITNIKKSFKNQLLDKLKWFVSSSNKDLEHVKKQFSPGQLYEIIKKIAKNIGELKYYDEGLIKDLDSKIRDIVDDKEIMNIIKNRSKIFFGEKGKKDIAKSIHEIVESLNKELIFIIVKEIYNCLRRNNYKKKKCNNHVINIIFSGDLFSNMHKKLLWNQLDSDKRKKYASKKLKKIKEYSEKQEYENIRFYYHNRALLSEVKVISSELALISSVTQNSVKVINDVNSVTYYYDKCIDLLEHRDTLKIKEIDLGNLKNVGFTFDEGDEYFRKDRLYKEFFMKQTQEDIKMFLKNIFEKE